MAVVAVANRTSERAAKAFHEAGVTDVVEVDAADELERVLRTGRSAITRDASLLHGQPARRRRDRGDGDDRARRGCRPGRHHPRQARRPLQRGARGNTRAGARTLCRTGRRGADGHRRRPARCPVQPAPLRARSRPHPCPLRQRQGHARSFEDRPRRSGRSPRGGGRRRQHGHEGSADGTKLAFEQAVIGNALGFGVLRRGMDRSPVRRIRGRSRAPGVVGCGPARPGRRRGRLHARRAPAGAGVFVLALEDDPARRRHLELLKLGEGPLYCFTTPFHLCAFEVPFTVARAALFGDATVTPTTNSIDVVATSAKRDLHAGETLDGIGWTATYGLCENADVVLRRLPPADRRRRGLHDAPGCRVRRGAHVRRRRVARRAACAIASGASRRPSLSDSAGTRPAGQRRHSCLQRGRLPRRVRGERARADLPALRVRDRGQPEHRRLAGDRAGVRRADRAHPSRRARRAPAPSPLELESRHAVGEPGRHVRQGRPRRRLALPAVPDGHGGARRRPSVSGPRVGIPHRRGLGGSRRTAAAHHFPARADVARSFLLGRPWPFLFGSRRARRSCAPTWSDWRDSFYFEGNIHADTEACLQVLSESDFGFVHQVLTYTRRHNEAVTAFTRRIGTYISSDVGMFQRWGPAFLTPDRYDRALRPPARLRVLPRTPRVAAATSWGIRDYHEERVREILQQVEPGRHCTRRCPPARPHPRIGEALMCGLAGMLDLVTGLPSAERLVASMTDVLTHRGPDDAGMLVDGPLTLGHRRLSIIDLAAHGTSRCRPTTDGCGSPTTARSTTTSSCGTSFHRARVRVRHPDRHRSAADRPCDVGRRRLREVERDVRLRALGSRDVSTRPRSRPIRRQAAVLLRGGRAVAVRASEIKGIRARSPRCRDAPTFTRCRVPRLRHRRPHRRDHVRRHPPGSPGRVRDGAAARGIDPADRLVPARCVSGSASSQRASSAANRARERRRDAAAQRRARGRGAVGRPGLDLGSSPWQLRSAAAQTCLPPSRSPRGRPIRCWTRARTPPAWQRQPARTTTTFSLRHTISSPTSSPSSGTWTNRSTAPRCSASARSTSSRGHTMSRCSSTAPAATRCSRATTISTTCRSCSPTRDWGDLVAFFRELRRRKQIHGIPRRELLFELAKRAVDRAPRAPEWLLSSLHVPRHARPRSGLAGHQEYGLLVSPLPAYNHHSDRNSMTFSIETRNPMLDVRLVELARGLDARHLLRAGLTKWALRKAVSDVVPEPVLRRTDKQGFTTDQKLWLDGELGVEMAATSGRPSCGLASSSTCARCPGSCPTLRRGAVASQSSGASSSPNGGSGS